MTQKDQSQLCLGSPQGVMGVELANARAGSSGHDDWGPEWTHDANEPITDLPGIPQEHSGKRCQDLNPCELEATGADCASMECLPGHEPIQEHRGQRQRDQV